MLKWDKSAVYHVAIKLLREKIFFFLLTSNPGGRKTPSLSVKPLAMAGELSLSIPFSLDSLSL